MNRSKQRKPKRCQKCLLAMVFLCCCLTGRSQTTNRFFQFVEEQSHRRYQDIPREILAAYYVWYGQPGREGWGELDVQRQQSSLTVRYPVKGAYSSADPAIIDWHIDQAKSCGITAFATSWWGMGEWESWIDKSFQILIERAEKKDFKVALYWEQAPGHGSPQIERAVAELSYCLIRFGRSRAFLKVNGKPVILVYGRVIHDVPVAAWPEIIRQTRAKAGDFVLLADGYQSSYAYLFDGLHTYGPDGDPSANKPAELPAWAERFYSQGVELARKHGRISCVVVTPGYDDRKMNKPGSEVSRRNGDRYREMWSAAIKVNPHWVLITSWNEWGEGTEIEPSVELGNTYLDLTAEYSRRFLNSARAAGKATSPVADLTSGGARRLEGLLAGKKVGVLVLDRKNDAEFWSACCGATVQRLAWADLIKPSVFNAREFPLVIFITGEHFTGTVEKPGDVKQALVRYLSQGGVFMSLPVFGVWPLYYDDSLNGRPAAITDDLRLGVSNGWEEPPSGVQFMFHVCSNGLSGLRGTVPYPEAGDLRWRPTTRSRVPAQARYFPLIQLKDSQGRFYGEGAVYVEQRTLPVSPGKTIFVSPRVSDAFGTEQLYPALFDFISTKLKPAPTEKR